ncbi:MAG: DUF2062 domain-containing protein [Burkholderiales bacterium]|nr:MAG: DUF2062 domain-containing protein [Burkholderiales bacterium]
MARKLVRRWLPEPEHIQTNRWLRWLGPVLRRPWLWQINRRTVATGVAIGMFFGFMVPIAQIPLSAVFAWVFRANLPAAAVSTLVSNPFTYAPIWVLAYRLGAAILGEPVNESTLEGLAEGLAQAEVVAVSWIDRISAIGKPLLLGLSIFAVGGAILGYAMVMLAWRIGIWLRMLRRRDRRSQAAPR